MVGREDAEVLAGRPEPCNPRHATKVSHVVVGTTTVRGVDGKAPHPSRAFSRPFSRTLARRSARSLSRP